MTAKALVLAGTLLAALTLPHGAAAASAHDDAAALASGEPEICQYVGAPVSQWYCVRVQIGSHA